MPLCLTLFVKLFGLPIIVLATCLDHDGIGTEIESRIGPANGTRMASNIAKNCEEGIKDSCVHQKLEHDSEISEYLNKDQQQDVKRCLKKWQSMAERKKCKAKLMRWCEEGFKFKLRYNPNIQCTNCKNVLNVKLGCSKSWNRFLLEKPVLNGIGMQTTGRFGCKCDVESRNGKSIFAGVCL